MDDPYSYAAGLTPDATGMPALSNSYPAPDWSQYAGMNYPPIGDDGAAMGQPQQFAGNGGNVFGGGNAAPWGGQMQQRGGAGGLQGFAGGGGGGMGNMAAMAGGNPALLAQLFNAQQQQYNTARNANLTRYAQILGTQKMIQPTQALNRFGAGEVDAQGKPVMGDLSAADQQQNAETQAANGGYQGLYQRGMGYINSLSNNQQKLLDEQYGGMQARQTQDLTNRGLMSSTVAPVMQNAIEREHSFASNDLQDRLMRERLTADSSLSGQTLNFMTNRTDAYPDPSTMTNLAFQLGQAGGGYGAGGATGGAPGQSYATGNALGMSQFDLDAQSGGINPGHGGASSFANFRPGQAVPGMTGRGQQLYG